ncbi:MAG TPA: alkaline phosphatase family protein [Kofleriaceae bacterium]|nr:alkaline phosphatase family protein [Kofleriaceae bacterium]
MAITHPIASRVLPSLAIGESAVIAPTFTLNRVGTLRVVCRAQQIRRQDDDAPENRHIPPPPPHPIEGVVDLPWSLVAPDGTVAFAHRVPTTFPEDRHVAWAHLDDFRDALGFCSHAWSIRIANPFQHLDLRGIHIEITVDEPALASHSPGPIADRAIDLAPGATTDVALTIDRLGELRYHVDPIGPFGPKGPPTFSASLVDPHGEVVATGRDGKKVIDRALWLASAGHPWTLRLTRTDDHGDAARVKVSAQIYEQRRLALSIVNDRLSSLGLSDLRIEAGWRTFGGRTANFVTLDVASTDLWDTVDLLDGWRPLEQLAATSLAAGGVTVSDPPPKILPNQPYYISLISIDKPVTVRLRDFVVTTIKAELRAGANGAPMFAVHFGFRKSPIPQVELPFPFENRSVSDLSIDLALALTLDGGRVKVMPTVSASMTTTDDIRDAIVGSLQDHVGALGPALTDLIGVAIARLLGAPYELTKLAVEGSELVVELVPEKPIAPSAPNPAYRSGRAGVTAPPPFTSPNMDKIDHIVVLMQENRSFDHVLGHVSLDDAARGVDGLTPQILASWREGTPAPLAGTKFQISPDHSYEGVARQMGYDASMRGFMADFLVRYPWLVENRADRLRDFPDHPEYADVKLADVMGYHPHGQLTVHDALVDGYAICDRWFSSHPGPTFPNRYFELMGQLTKDRWREPERNGPREFWMQRSRNLFDLLTEQGVDWRYYESPPDVTMLRMFAGYALDDTHLRPMSDFHAAARAGRLPQVSFLDPRFYAWPTSDDHPPADMRNGEALIAQIYLSLTSNKAAWAKTLFIITYDEHGGFYDHVSPPIADIVGSGANERQVRYGVRVPTYLVSPWVEAKAVDHGVYCHASIAKTILGRFCGANPPFLSDRVLWANSLWSALTRDTARIDVPMVTAPAALVAEKAPAPPRGRDDWHAVMGRLASILRG